MREGKGGEGDGLCLCCVVSDGMLTEGTGRRTVRTALCVY